MIFISNYYKKTEAMLYNYKTTKAEIKNIAIEIEELQNDYIGCSSITYEEKSAPTNKFNSSVENEAINKEHELKRLERLKHHKELQIEKIDNALEQLPIEESRLIKLRYFDRLSFKVIGQRLCMNSDYLTAKRNKIINGLINVLFFYENT